MSTKRLLWFNEGAAAFRRTWERIGDGGQRLPPEDIYPCPICLRGFRREALDAKLLTEEHAPPGSLGGRGLLLTCATCNNGSGHLLDAHAQRRRTADMFVRSESVRPLPATFHADGVFVRGTAVWTDGGLVLNGVPQQNDPRELQRCIEAVQGVTGQGIPNPKFSFTIHTRYDDAKARLSWIRSAYLVAFAALGWTYAFRPELDAVREQVLYPDSDAISTHLLRNFDADPAARQIAIIDQPAELRSLAITMGEHVVVLPSPTVPRTWSEIVSSVERRTGVDQYFTETFHGKQIPWPTRPTYFLDS